MLRKVNEGGVVSDEGYSIQITGPESLEYKSILGVVAIDMAFDPIKKVVYVYASSVTEFNGEDKSVMISNVQKAVALLEGNFLIV